MDLIRQGGWGVLLPTNHPVQPLDFHHHTLTVCMQISGPFNLSNIFPLSLCGFILRTEVYFFHDRYECWVTKLERREL